MAVAIALACLIAQHGARAESPCVALTFDDGPTAVTEELLDALAEREIRATFFLCCYRISQYPETVRRMAQDGHEIGIHGCSHAYFTQMSESRLRQEIDCTGSAVAALTGRTPTLLRPPGGLYNDTVCRTAAQYGLPVILWSIDPEDWDPRHRAGAADHVVQRAKNGDIVLLHDLSRENVRAALEIADRLTEQGVQFRTVSDLANQSDAALQAGKIHRRFSR